jgi:HSP20 family protein
MANLTVWDPFTEAGLDDLFRGFLRPTRFETKTPMQIKMDVSEDDKSYTVRAEIPGVKKEDIHVAIDGNQVSISAEVKKESEEKEGDKILRSERYFGSVYRSFALASEIDEGLSEAKYDNGVLQLKLAKRKESQAKKLSIA